MLECTENPDGDSELRDELEVQASDSAQSSSSSAKITRKRTYLHKKEKTKLVYKLRGISVVQLLDVVVQKLSEDNHMQFYPERAQVMSSLLDSSYEKMIATCAGLADKFACTYLNCERGKEKYAQFQVQWHQCCSKFLLPVDEPIVSCTTSGEQSPVQLWHTLTGSITQEVLNPLMIAISAEIYGFMLLVESPNER